MDFSFSSEQAMLRDSVERYLADHYDFAERQTVVHGSAGWRPQVWRAFAEDLGILGAAFPESLGGFGGGPVETMLIMEALGGALVVEPYLETVVIGGGLLKRGGGEAAAGLIAEIIAGETTFALAHCEPQARYGLAEVAATATRDAQGWRLNGVKDAAAGAPWASRLVVTARTAGRPGEADGVSLFIVPSDTPGVALSPYPSVDGGRAADVTFRDVMVGDDARLGEPGAGLALLEPVIDEATVALCAEAVGVMRRMHAQTVEYARQRRQFGAPLADFQVLQHRMVDMFIAIEQAVSMTYMATLKLDHPAAERARAVSAAKVQIGKSCRIVGQGAIQIHGGMGMTQELAVSHYFKRATIIEQQFGGVDYHLARYEALALAGA